jgi:hypothetical protein
LRQHCSALFLTIPAQRYFAIYGLIPRGIAVLKPSSIKFVLSGASGSEKAKIDGAIERLHAGGGTASAAGIELACQAKGTFAPLRLPVNAASNRRTRRCSWWP